MADSRHVAFYVPALRVGGAQRVTITLANGLAERGHDVDLVLSYREGELLSQVDDAVSVVDLRTPKVPVLGILASVPRMRSYLETVEPLVLFAAITYANVTSLLAGAVADTDTRVVPTEHNRFEMESGLKSAVTSVLARRLYRLADGIVAVSAGVATSVADGTGVARNDVTVLYNPVPIADVRSKAQEPIDEQPIDAWLRSSRTPTIVSVGRLEAPKDPETLLRAFERVNSVRPDTRLILVGDGSKREELFDLAERLDIDEAVSLPGYAANPYAYMGRASVFVLSSEFEGLPTVLTEALACGCPVVATDCPSGPREILADGEYGTLVPVGDATALGDAIRSTLKTPTDPEKLTRRARDFSVETIVDQYEGFIEQLIDRRADGRAR